MTTEQTTEAVRDFYSWFKETTRFEVSELNEEIAEQVAQAEKANPAFGVAFKKAIEESETTRLLCQRVIMDCAILFAAAFSIDQKNEWDDFSKKMLESVKEDDVYAKYVRQDLLFGSGLEARQDIRKTIDQQEMSEVDRRKMALRYEIRLDEFGEAYKKMV
jgi:hypothetical protein